MHTLPFSGSSESRYQDWYVLHTDSSKAGTLIHFVKKRLGSDFPIVSFTRELVHLKKDQYLTIEKPLFPGYLFVQKHLDAVRYLLNENFRDVYAHAVCFDGKPARVNTQEMQYLFNLANEEGRVTLSKAYREGDTIVITSGPLSNMQGNIKFIDQKKRKVKVSFTLLNATVNVSLSYDLIEKKKTTNVA